MSTTVKISDGEHDVTADDLVTGRLYVLVEGADGKNHLRHLPRQPDDLPRIRITEDALAAVRRVARGMRKAMQGYRPDATLVLSALVLDACSRPDAARIVRDFAIAKFQTAQSGESEAESAESVAEEGDIQNE